MPYFRYRAMDQTGRLSRGQLAAVNEVDLELRLKRMGLDLINLRLLRQNQYHGGERITRRDLITFCFHLEQISRAGVPLLDGLRDLRDTMDSAGFRDILTALLEDLEGGKMLSQALAAHPAIFDTVFINVVRAGEQTGRLDLVFGNLAATLKWQDEAAAKAKRLMVYPAIVSAFVLLTVVVMLVYLVPRFEGFLLSTQVKLPPTTLFLFGLAKLFRTWWYAWLGGAALLGTLAVLWVRHTERGRWWWDRTQLKLPVLGSVLQKILLARFAHYLALLYRAGVTVLEALKTAEDIAGNRVIAASLREAGQKITEGVGLTESFRSLGLFPPLVIRMLRVGENTGALDLALENVTYFYNREVEEAIDRGMKVLEPMLLVVLASILLFFALSVLMPVYDMAFSLPT